MPWSVLAPASEPLDENGRRRVYDVVVRRRGFGDGIVLLERRDEPPRHIGWVLHDRIQGGTDNWWAMSFVPGYLDQSLAPTDPELRETVEGFVTRRAAIQHMLRMTGWSRRR